MTDTPLSRNTRNGRVYDDTLGDCDLLRSRGWTGPFKDVPSVTNINNMANRGGGLDLWKRRTVAEWAVDNVDTWVELETHGINANQWERTVKKWAEFAGWKGRKAGSVYMRAITEYQAAVDAGDRDTCLAWHRKLLIDMVAAAPDRHSQQKAQQGTELHKVFEDVANGRTPVALMPGDQVYIDQVKDFFDRWQPEIICCEQPVFSRTHGYAGCPDNFMKLPSAGTLITDLKRRNQVYSDVAYQLAPYVNADYWIDTRRNVRKPIPTIDGAAVIHFPPDLDENGRFQPATVYPIDLDGAMDVFLHTLELYKDRNRRRVNDPLEAPNVIPGDPDKRAHLVTRVACLKAWYRPAALWASQHWPKGVPTLSQSDSHTAAELDLIEKVLNDAEAACEVPFYEVVDPNSKSMSAEAQPA